MTVLITHPVTGHMISAGKVVNNLFHPNPKNVIVETKEVLLNHLRSGNCRGVVLPGQESPISLDEYAQMIR